MTEATDKLKASAKEKLAELQQARDEIRLKLHLAGMESKDAFNDLEGRLTKLEARAHEVGDAPAKELFEAFDHLRVAFRTLSDNLKKK